MRIEITLSYHRGVIRLAKMEETSGLQHGEHGATALVSLTSGRVWHKHVGELTGVVYES